MQKHVNLIELVKSFPTNIYLQNLASIQKRTSPLKFAHLAEKSEIGSRTPLQLRCARAPAPPMPTPPRPALSTANLICGVSRFSSLGPEEISGAFSF